MSTPIHPQEGTPTLSGDVQGGAGRHVEAIVSRETFHAPKVLVLSPDETDLAAGAQRQVGLEFHLGPNEQFIVAIKDVAFTPQLAYHVGKALMEEGARFGGGVLIAGANQMPPAT